MKCEHCGLDFKKDTMIESSGKFFCCRGCEGVWEILHTQGLEEFYQRLGNQTLKPVSHHFETKNYEEFITKTKDGFSEIYLLIHGIECAACVWLNEKILIRQEGILELELNHLSHKARIVFDENVIDLRQILSLIESIGYKASAFSLQGATQKAEILKRELYAKMIVGIACVMNIMWVAVAKYAGFFDTMQSDVKDILNFAEFILASPVLFYTGSHFYKSAFKALKNHSLNMDTLVISGASLAYLYSLWAMFSRVGEVYFDSVAMIICFVFVGRYLELFSKKRALDTLDGLNDFLQKEVMVLREGQFILEDATKVKAGEVILLRAGDRILIDGICLKGEVSVDSSSLNGESSPVLVGEGGVINSACLVLDGRAEYQTTIPYSESKLAQIIKLLEFASTKKTKLTALVSEISAYFSPTILVLAFLCFCFWFFYWDKSVEISLVNAISVLIIACPCALALATPVSNLIALGRALSAHILFKDCGVIENLSKCDYVVFDKTGVLTKSRLEVCDFYFNDGLNLNLLLSFVLLSKHPVALSVAEFLQKKVIGGGKFDFKDVQNLSAKGICATLGEDIFVGGNEKFLKERGINVKKSFSGTHFIVAKNGEILAFFELESVLRDGALELVDYLKKEKKKMMILSGDNEQAVKKIALKLGISKFKASCYPQDKMQEIQKLTQAGHRVLFVGDGINDALALKWAGVAITLREGSDLAIENSEVLLMKNDLLSLKIALRLSKNTLKIIKQNLAFSLGYNALTIPLAFCGLINPLIAALSMSFSSIMVILNALRIKQ